MLSSCLNDLFKELNIKIEDYYITDEQIRGTCPCHDSNNFTAWTYYFNKNIWFCWTRGCHQKKGSDLIGLIACINDTNVGQACWWAKDFLKKRKITEKSVAIKLKQNVLQNGSHSDYWREHILQKSFPNNILSKLQDARPFLRMRGLDPNLAQRFNLGYANKGDMRNRIVFPVKNIDGKIVGFTGRTILDQTKFKVPKWVHLPKKRFHTNINLFNIDKAKRYVRQTNSIILVEGPIDILKLEMAGYKNAVAVFGLNITSGQLELIQKCGAIHILLAFDPDRIDSREVRNTICKLQEKDFDVEILRWQGEEDIGAMEINKLNDVFSKINIPNFRRIV
jgi:5S rRNA maturation endonuclease (ribonuclease M5)